MLHNSTGWRAGAVLSALLVAIATIAPTLPANAVDDQQQEQAEVAPALRDADGTVVIVARLGDHVVAASSPSPEAALQSRADRSQQPLLSFAEDKAQGVTVVNRLWLANAVVLRVDTDRTSLRRLARVQGVQQVHPNFEVSLLPPVEAASDRAERAGGSMTSEAEENTTYGLDQINAPEAWEAHGTKGAGATVAVLDTGVEVSHPDIELRTDDPGDPTYPGGWAEFDEAGNVVPGSEPYDSGDHGTHVSGTVAGGNASGEWIGVAPEASLMHGLVLPDGSGSFAQVVAGMQWAVDGDADVISMSLGAPGHYGEFIQPVRNAEAAGTMVVAASGNDNEGISGTPGNVYESLAVGASNASLAIAGFSSGEVVDTEMDWGSAAPESWPDTYVVPDVSAPGVAVRSAMPNGGYHSKSGTSMATPHVAGTVALMISASEQDLTVSEMKTILRQTAFKPDDCDPSCTPREGRDTRYGAGIIDAKAATDRAVMDSGVTGVVRDADGEPMQGVTVTVDGQFHTETEANGEYSLLAAPGNHEVQAAAFGYATVTEQVTVLSSTFVTANLTLADAVAVRVTEEPPQAIQGGDDATVTVSVANVATYTVDMTGSYADADATLHVNGTPREFGEPIALDGYSGTLTVTVGTTPDTSGTFSLQHAFEGEGETIQATTGPTEVFTELTGVAVIDSNAGFGGQVAEMLDEQLPDRYKTTVVADENALQAVGDYKVFVVQDIDPVQLDVESFIEATSSPETGVVWLDQYGPDSDGISVLSDTTGDPAEAGSSWLNVGYPYFEITQSHPLFYGVGAPDDRVTAHTGGGFTGGRSSFGGYSKTVLADVGDGEGIAGSAIGIDPSTSTVLAASLGRKAGVTNEDYTAEADQILTNAIRFVADDGPPVTLVTGAPRLMEPGESASLSFDVAQLDQVMVELSDEGTLAAGDVTVRIEGGEPIEFGEPVQLDPAVTEEDYTVTVETDADAVGTFALDYTFVGGEDDETVEIATRQTSVYAGPVNVPGDVDSIQAGVDLAAPGATIVVEDGTYTETVTVDEESITLRAADGAAPVIQAPEDTNAAAVVDISAENVTLRGFTLDAFNVRTGVEVNRVGATVKGMTVRNASYTAILVLGEYGEFSENTTVAGNTVTDSTYGIRLYYTDHSTVKDNSAARVTYGIDMMMESYGNVVMNNAVTNASTAIRLNPSYHDASDNRVDGNQVSSSGVGIDVISEGIASITNNVIEADTGVLVKDVEPSDALRLRYNDLSGSTVMVDNPEDAVFDARLNYYGDRGPADPEAALEGPVRYDPFLTVAPEAIDDTADVTSIATDVTMAAGKPHALGIPGPTGQSIWDILGPEFSGEVYRYASKPDKWKQVRGDGRWSRVSALDAFKVVPDNDTRAVMTFQRTSGGRNIKQLEPGWNFVAAPSYGFVEDVFGESTADLTKAQPALGDSVLTPPSSQLGPIGELEGVYRFGDDPPGPAISAFTGYLVHADSGGWLSATVTVAPTVEELYEGLGLEYDAPSADAPGAKEATRLSDAVAGASSGEQEALAEAIAAAVTDDDIGKALVQHVAEELRQRPEATLKAAINAASGTEREAVLDIIAEVMR